MYLIDRHANANMFEIGQRGPIRPGKVEKEADERQRQ